MEKNNIKETYTEEYKIPMSIMIPFIYDFLNEYENFSNRWKARELAENLFEEFKKQKQKKINNMFWYFAKVWISAFILGVIVCYYFK